MRNRTKIVCTIGPSVASYKQILNLIDAGMNVARLNFSHGTHEDHLKVIENLKKARIEKNISLAIMLDTKGPEIRVGKFKDGIISVTEGQQILLTGKSIIGDETVIPMTPGFILNDVSKGMHILFDDGYISAFIVKKTQEGAIIEFENSGVLRDHKGINIPHEGISIPAVTEQDIADLKFGCAHDIDIVAASFICSAAHVMEIKHLLSQEGHPEILVISKIENVSGVKNFDSILQVSDGIMVARGDLGVELPLTKVPKLQKMMIRKCYESAKPVVTATQMLESMILNIRPTRAEVSDVANAIYDSTSAVMLSGETAVGKYPIHATKMMYDVASEAEKDFDYEKFFFIKKVDHCDVSTSVALAAVKTAYSAEAKAIFCFTSKGFTARKMSALRPSHPIIAVTASPKTYNQLALVWGVIPVLKKVQSANEGFDAACQFALEHKILQLGDLVVITYGTPFGISGTTNAMHVRRLEK